MSLLSDFFSCQTSFISKKVKDSAANKLSSFVTYGSWVSQHRNLEETPEKLPNCVKLMLKPKGGSTEATKAVGGPRGWLGLAAVTSWGPAGWGRGGLSEVAGVLYPALPGDCVLTCTAGANGRLLLVLIQEDLIAVTLWSHVRTG